MKMEVKVISKEFIKPSSPTPYHLRHLHFSFIDQLFPHNALPLIYFYPNKSTTTTNSERCKLLKKSLSEVLTIFYPIAGRVNNNSYIYCNDQGVLFVEAEVNCQLSDALSDRYLNNNVCFVPPGKLGDLAACCQITFFSCGGIAISFSLTHKVGDFLSIITFLKSWADIVATRNTNANNDVVLNNALPFGSAIDLFPPLDMDMFRVDYDVLIAKEKLVAKAFMFDSAAIANLKAQYSGIRGRRLSRVEALTDFICTRLMDTSHDKNKKCMVTQSVNLRAKMDPPLSMATFGNYSMADSCGTINAEFIKKLQNKDERINYIKRAFGSFSNEEVVPLSISSVINLPLYDIDFGWGKPLWTTTTPMPTKNAVVLVPTTDGLGIEALVTLKEEDMAKFELDDQLLQHVSAPPFKLQDIAHSRFHSRL